MYNANISTSSGITDYLNDFKLLDNPVVEYDPSHIDNCVWIPDANDKLATATISFDAPQDIEYIYLYDNPAQNSNVLNARISFDDGSTLETGPLNSNGSAAKFCVEKSDVLSFSVQILKTEGDAAGLTEIEAYGYSRDYGFNFVKVTDMDGNFVYDYYTSQDGDCQLLLYSPGTQEDFQISSDNPRCSVTYESGNISVICPKGQSCTIRVDSSDGEFSDTVRVSNPGRFMRETGPRYEKLLRQFPNGNMQKSNSYLLLRAIYRAIR